MYSCVDLLCSSFLIRFNIFLLFDYFLRLFYKITKYSCESHKLFKIIQITLNIFSFRSVQIKGVGRSSKTTPLSFRVLFCFLFGEFGKDSLFRMFRTFLLFVSFPYTFWNWEAKPNMVEEWKCSFIVFFFFRWSELECQEGSFAQSHDMVQ